MSTSEAQEPTNLRDAQAALTRAHIAEAARQLFLARGYVGTPMTAIARRAGVAVQTIYNVVGNKSAVLSAVLDLVAAGPNAPVPVPRFMEQRAAATADFDGIIAVLADWFVEVHPRTTELFGLIRQAAAVDAEVAALENERGAQRLRNYLLAAAQLRERGGLTRGQSDEDAAAAIWALAHPDTYRELVTARGWSAERYRHWLAQSLSAALR